MAADALRVELEPLTEEVLRLHRLPSKDEETPEIDVVGTWSGRSSSALR